MKSALPIALTVCLLGSNVPVPTQEPPAPRGASPTVQNGESRFAEGRRVHRHEGGRLEEAHGWLVSDRQRKQFRFEIDFKPAFEVPYDRVTAMHYENSIDASKWGWPLKDTNDYIVIHYADDGRHSAFEAVRLSGRDVSWALDAFEEDAGVKFERTRARRSFLGIPIRATVGDHVIVTYQTGRAMEGTISGLSAASVTIEGPSGTRRVFDAASVNSIRRTRSRGRDVRRTFGIGALVGGVAGGLFGRGLGGDTTSAVEGAALMGGITGGVGALVAFLSPSYRDRATRDIYLRE